MWNPIRRARRKIWKAFEKDPGFKYGYVANVAMVIQDNSSVEHKLANELAEKIVDHIFKEE